MSLIIEQHRLHHGYLVQSIAGVSVVTIGVLGQMSDISPGVLHESSFDLHLAFAFFLNATVLIRFNCGLWKRENSSADAIAHFSRQVNRMVYVLLYGLIGVKAVHGSVPISETVMFQPYLSSGITAIFLNHALTALSRQHCASRNPPLGTREASIAARTRALIKAVSSSAWR